MKQEKLVQSTDEELLQEQKKAKLNNTLYAFLIGFLVGIAGFSAVRNGFGFGTFAPLVLAYIAFGKKKKL